MNFSGPMFRNVGEVYVTFFVRLKGAGAAGTCSQVHVRNVGRLPDLSPADERLAGSCQRLRTAVRSWVFWRGDGGLTDPGPIGACVKD